MREKLIGFTNDIYLKRHSHEGTNDIYLKRHSHEGTNYVKWDQITCQNMQRAASSFSFLTLQNFSCLIS
jgi:hypothetical protein